MTENISIVWTSGSIDEARKIARYLVQERLVACARITPWAESIYMWNSQLETVQESVVTCKTRRDNFELVKSIIEDNHKYEIPEILVFNIEGGNEAYLNWIGENVVDGKTAKLS